MQLRISASLAFSAACMVLFTASAAAQDPPVEWGKVSMEDLAMKTCPTDSGADAMVLADYGQSSVNKDLGIDYERHLRVKLFKTSAFDRWGTRGISLWTKTSNERLVKVEGVTYSLGSDGQIVRSELSDDAVYKEKVDNDNTRYRWTMPALTPGCIVDMRYREKLRRPDFMPSWVFQYDIPSRWSEYRVVYPKQVVYAVVTTSYLRFSIDENTEVLRRFTGDAGRYIGGEDGVYPCYFFRLAMRDLPALTEEPYITTMDDYRPKVQIQLAAWARMARDAGTVMKTWEKLVEEILDWKDFGKKLEPDRTVRDLSARITAGCQTPSAKMNALYDYVRTSIVWDENYQVTSSADPDDIISAKRGNSSDINFLLMSLLNAAGIETHPVILSTRTNGKITKEYPLIEQFNLVIAQAIIGESTYYLDATNHDRPSDLLPPSVLNVCALVVKPGPVQWVTLGTTHRATHRARADVILDADGQIHGTIESTDEEYSALKRRHEIKDTKPLEVARTMFDAAKTGLEIDSSAVTGKDSLSGPLRIKAHLAASPYAQAGGDFLYITPDIVDRTTTNPFKSQTRAFPVDMAYPYSDFTVSVFHIPDGFEVKDLPAASAALVGSSDAFFSRVISQDGNVITCTTKEIVNKSQFPPEMYASLKDFYDKIVKSNGDRIVLKRKPSPPPAEAPKKKATASSPKRKKK